MHKVVTKIDFKIYKKNPRYQIQQEKPETSSKNEWKQKC